MKNAEIPVPRFALTIPETARAIGSTQATVYGLIERGLLRTFVLNRKRLTTPEWVGDCVKLVQEAGSPLPQDRHSGQPQSAECSAP